MPGTVLFLSHEASRTGAPILLLNFLRWFRQNRNVNLRILTGRPGDLTSDFAAIGPVDSFQPSGAVWYKAMRWLQLQRRHDSNHLANLREIFLRDTIDLIYVNSIASAEMLEFLSFVNCPVVCHVHELDGAIRAIGVENLARLEKRRPLYIAVSRAVKSNLVENHGIPASRVEVIHGFVPNIQDRAIDPGKAHRSIRRKLKIAENAKLVCACGSIELRKGTDLFLQIANNVVQKYRTAPVHFVWVGGKSDKVAAMRNQVAKSALRDVVHFVGSTLDTGAYFGASEIFLLTSREDPFPLVVLEAAQYGRPIVCFESAGGAPEFVESDAGIVVPGFDVVKLADIVVELLSSPVLCNQLGKAAKQKVSRYDLNVGASKIAAVIADTMHIRGEGSQHEDVMLSQ